MGLTKRWMETEAETTRKSELAYCGCSYNWDDKFEVLCPKHEAERAEKEEDAAEYAWDIYRHAVDEPREE